MSCILLSHDDGVKVTLYQPFEACQRHASTDKSCESCSKITKLQGKIAETKQVLEDMLKRHHELTTRANDVHDPFASLLPPEVTAKIFQCYVLDPDFADSRPEWRKAPLRLGAVCRRWRQIAWTTPALWSQTAFYVRGHSQPDYHHFARDWLARSGDLPLEISIGADCGPRAWEMRSKTEAILGSLIDILNLHSRRWHTLEISLTPLMAQRLGGNLHPAPALQELRMSLSADPVPLAGDQSVELDLTSANPKHITLYLHFPLRILKIGWNSLVKADLHGYRIDEYLNFLSRTPALTHARFTDIRPRPRGSPQHVVHQNLQTLSVVQSIYNDGTWWSQLLQDMTLPALERITYYAFYSSVPIPAIRSMVHRSGCALQELTLRNVIMVEDNLIELLAVTPALRILELEWSRESACSPYRLLRHLSRTSIFDPLQSELFLPELQSFHLDYQETAYLEEIADLFGPLVVPPGMRRRPLQNIEVIFDAEHRNLNPEHVPCEEDYIDRELVLRFLAIIRAGCSVMIRCVLGEEVEDHIVNVIDLLEESVKQLDIPVSDLAKSCTGISARHLSKK